VQSGCLLICLNGYLFQLNACQHKVAGILEKNKTIKNQIDFDKTIQ